jgi:predicted short-subunit dehydrogenase-like oxidoreductase (DUF2520 family)
VSIETVRIVGTGVAASALGHAIQSCDLEIVAVAGRNLRARDELARKLDVPAQEISETTPPADLIILAVSDDAIELVCSEVSTGADLTGSAVAHCAGALDLAPLSPAAAAGARIGKLHPLASLAGGATRAIEIAWGIDGSDALTDELVDLVERLYGTPIRLDKVDLAVYHLAAVFASNYALGLLGVASDLWNLSGAPLPASRALFPLVEGTIRNWEEMGLERALTGPIGRGDAKAVAAQLRALVDRAPELEPLYRALGLATAAVAARRADSDEERLSAINRILAKMQW